MKRISSKLWRWRREGGFGRYCVEVSLRVLMVVVLVAVWRVWRTCTFDSRCEMGNGPSLLLEWETEGGPYRLSTMTWPGL